MSTKFSILIIDDEPQIQKLLERIFQEEYKVLSAFTGDSGLTMTAMYKPDIIILDVQLPDLNGIEVLKQIRQWSKVPIIVVSVVNNEEEIVSFLDNGADDYVTKPFRSFELLARVRASLRHTVEKVNVNSIFSIGSLKVDLTQREVFVNENIVHLTVTEYNLLLLFIQHKGKVLTYQMILKEIWGNPFAEEHQYVRVYVNSLRKKIEPNPALPQYILTESRVGYRLQYHL